MKRSARSIFSAGRWIVASSIFLLYGVLGAATPVEHPLEPPDRSSPRATMETFLSSVNEAWTLYSAGDPGFAKSFREARESLDLSEVPPLVYLERSAETALMLKDILDRLQLPRAALIPDAAAVVEEGLTRWTLPHTEITLLRVAEGERAGQWLFSKGTVERVPEYFDRVQHLPLQPGRLGGHVEELRSGSRAVVLLKLAEVMPSWFSAKVGGMIFWQWIGLAIGVAMLIAMVGVAVWVGRRCTARKAPGHRLAAFFVPAVMISSPMIVRLVIERLFPLPGAPALVVRLCFSMVGYAGLAWLVAAVFSRVGEATVKLFFRHARPLKKQLVRVIFRIATIAVITGIAVKALQILGVPVAGVVAGLGVGGLAIALAAQSTLENFIGGIILFADQPVRVGDLCIFGGRRGTVEDVGLRSVKIRTVDRTLVTVPNGDFAKMQLENLTRRDRVLMKETLRLQYGTTRDQLSRVLSGIESMLREHDRIDKDRLRVRLTGFGEHSLEVEIFADALTREFPEFFEIREDVLLKVMEIVEEAGTRLALPTEIHYVGGANEGVE